MSAQAQAQSLLIKLEAVKKIDRMTATMATYMREGRVMDVLQDLQQLRNHVNRTLEPLLTTAAKLKDQVVVEGHELTRVRAQLRRMEAAEANAAVAAMANEDF